MPNLGSDLGKRFQHEAPHVHGGMWDLQSGLVHYGIVEQKDIDIDLSWSFGRSPLSSHFLLNAENRCEELLGRMAGCQSHRTIQEPWLAGELDRLGFVER